MNSKKIEAVSLFQQRVYAALATVPPGRVTTYKMLAETVGCFSPRAIGQALRRNPFAPDIPCHRVIKSDLSIGGFMGEDSGAAVKRKTDLLREEGVQFISGKLKNRDLLFFSKTEKDINSIVSVDKLYRYKPLCTEAM